MPYIIQSVFLLVAPALFAASIYMELGRIINLTDGDSRSIIGRTKLTKIFVTGDVLSFFAQSGGTYLDIAYECWNLADTRMKEEGSLPKVAR